MVYLTKKGLSTKRTDRTLTNPVTKNRTKQNSYSRAERRITERRAMSLEY